MDGGREQAGQPGAGQVAAAQAAGQATSASTGDPAWQHVPRMLRIVAAWAWRLLLVGALVYFGFRAAVALRLLILPMFAAILLTALLQPLAGLLRRRVGLPALAATWCTVLACLTLLFAVGLLITNRVQADYPRLVSEIQATARHLQADLARPPFRLTQVRLQNISSRVLHYLSQHKSLVAGTVLTGGRIAIETVAGLILTVFITFFLIKDGDKIWAWLTSRLPDVARGRTRRAGAVAWQVLVSYMRGTTAIAAIHAAVIGVALWLLGVPLLVPLVIIVFLAAFVPLLGILVAGALAILVTLVTKGWIAALILLAVFVLENQLEGHLLQPLVIGRVVRLHPLAIIVVLTVGGIVAGVAGAIVAVPITAVIVYSWPELRGDNDDSPRTTG